MDTKNYSGNYNKSGIYLIRISGTKWFYIGSTSRFTKRKTDHCRDLRANKHHNPKMQNCFNKYGESNFIFEIVELVEKENLLMVEQTYLDKMYGNEGCLNVRPVAEGVGGDTRSKEELKRIYGRKKTIEEKEKIASSHKNRTFVHGIRKRKNAVGDYRLLAIQEAFVDGLAIPQVSFTEEEIAGLQNETKRLYDNFPRGWGKNVNLELINLRQQRKKAFKDWLKKNGFLVDRRHDSWQRKSMKDQQAALETLNFYRNKQLERQHNGQFKRR
jgi:group I intron endonuclease